MLNFGKPTASGLANVRAGWRAQVLAYGFAVTVTVLTLCARMSLSPWVGNHPVLVLFILPIIFSAYVGGLGPGLLSTALAAGGVYFFLLAPEHIHVLWFEGSVELWQWVILMVAGALVSLLIGALHRSRDQAAAIGQWHAVTLASIGDAVITTDEQGRVTFLNAEAERLTGWKNAEVAGEPLSTVFRIINQKTRATSADPVEKVLRTGSVVGLANHTVLISRNGREFIIDDSGAPIRRADGTIIGVVLVFRDNTEKTMAEDALQESQALYHSLVEQLPVGIFRKNAEGRYVFVNSFFCRLRHATPDQFLGKLPAELPASEAAFKTEAASHHAQIMQTGQPVVVLDEFHRADGATLYFQVVKSPVFNAEGKITGSQGVLLDITERKQAAEKIAHEQARFKLIFDAVPVGIAFHTVHPDGSFTRTINDAHLRICGLPREQHDQPEIYTQITHPEDHALQQKFVKQVNTGAIKRYSLEKRYLHPGGKTVWVNFSYQRETYPDGTIEELTTVVDITERKRLEEQLRQSQKMDAIGQLSGGVAHDFNNILTAILGNATLLSDPQIQPDEMLESVQEIIRATNRAADLTRQLLLFSRKQTMQPAPLDLNHVVSQSMKMLHRILGEDITILSEYAAGLPPIFADGGMIEQVILNLAVNARDAMPNGGRLKIRTSTETMLKPGAPDDAKAVPQVCLTVTDNGAGITPEILPHIFEPFFTTKDVGKGTGLGLATVYGIVQQHNGWITVTSQPGQGTTFDIYLPTIAGTPPSLPAVRPISQLPRGTGTILVVEDEPPVRLLLCQLLQRFGYTVVQAANGAEGLAAWQQHRETISLVLTDIIMPGGMSGHELAAQLLAQEPRLKIIFTSGYTGNSAATDAQLVEGSNFIRKPFAPEALAKIIRDKLASPATPA